MANAETETPVGDREQVDKSPQAVEGSNFRVPADIVILALGYSPDPEIGNTVPQLDKGWKGLFKVESEFTGATNIPGLYAAGDDVLANGFGMVVVFDFDFDHIRDITDSDQVLRRRKRDVGPTAVVVVQRGMRRGRWTIFSGLRDEG